VLQYLNEFRRAHLLEDGPFILGNRNRHTAVGALQMASEVISRDLIGDLLFAVHTAHRRFHNGQDVVGQ
jgi:hypothetical protein